MEFDTEAVLDELINFAQKKTNLIPEILENYLKEIARTGNVIFSWKQLMPLILQKLQQAVDKFHEQNPTEHLPQSPNVEPFKFDTMKSKLIEAIQSFSSTPFTIQRLCELLTEPHKHYRRTDKYMRGIEKNVLVVSSFSSSRVHSEANEHNSSMMNGAMEQPLSENGNSSVQLDSFVSAFSTGNERLQHSLSNHNHTFDNSIDSKPSDQLQVNNDDMLTIPCGAPELNQLPNTEDEPSKEDAMITEQQPSQSSTNVEMCETEPSEPDLNPTLVQQSSCLISENSTDSEMCNPDSLTLPISVDNLQENSAITEESTENSCDIPQNNEVENIEKKNELVESNLETAVANESALNLDKIKEVENDTDADSSKKDQSQSTLLAEQPSQEEDVSCDDQNDNEPPQLSTVPSPATDLMLPSEKCEDPQAS